MASLQQIEELLRHRFRREWILSGHQVAVDDDVRGPRVGPLEYSRPSRFSSISSTSGSRPLTRVELLDVRETGDSESCERGLACHVARRQERGGSRQTEARGLFSASAASRNLVIAGDAGMSSMQPWPPAM